MSAQTAAEIISASLTVGPNIESPPLVVPNLKQGLTSAKL